MKAMTSEVITVTILWLLWTILWASPQQNLQNLQSNTNLQCTPTAKSLLDDKESIESFRKCTSDVPGSGCIYCNYVCTPDFLHSDASFRNVIPVDTKRLLIVCKDGGSKPCHLPPGSLKHLKQLTDLGFYHCKFDKKTDVKEWLGGIQISRLFVEDSTESVNGTTISFVDSMYDNPNLESAILSRNKLTTLSTSLLCKWTLLATLWLNHNYISDLTFLFETCSNSSKCDFPLQSLEQLDLSNNNISAISHQLLSSFPKLQYLYLHSNKIYSIVLELPKSTAVTLKFSPIRELGISYNNLQKFELCKVLPLLIYLDVSGNHFECVPHYGGLDKCKAMQQLRVQNVSATPCEPMWTALSSMSNVNALWISKNNVHSLDFQKIPKSARHLQIDNCHIQTVTDVNNVSSGLTLVLLNMKSNELTYLDQFSFPPSLISLNLAINKISQIKPCVFSQCVELNSIELNDNRLTDISGLFSMLPKLSNLYLQNNNIISFDYSMIPKNLYYLSLSQNAITEITDDDQKINEVNLHYFNLSYNNFITLNKNSFAPSIFNLDLSNCEVDSCHADVFKNLKLQYYAIMENFTAHNVQNPYLTQTQMLATTHHFNEESPCNNVSYVCSCECPESKINEAQAIESCCNTYNSNGIFRGYPYFEFTLDVSSVKYCVVEISCFDLCDWVQFLNSSRQYNTMNKLFCNSRIDITQLFGRSVPSLRSKKFLMQRGLILNNMNITALKDGAFEGLKQLIVLNLDKNLIHEIRGCEFKNLKNLTKLYLNENHLLRLSPYSFKYLTELTFLELKVNRLRYLKRNLFVGLGRLQRLYLNDNVINYLPNSTFACLSSLKQLHLSVNKIQQIQQLSFLGLFQLRQLYLDKNIISSISEHGFVELIALEELYLENNVITTISNYTFNGLLHLRVLHLYDNQIALIEENSFGTLLSLSQLLLHSNQLTQWGIQLPKNLTKLTISQNQFPCNCSTVFHLRNELSRIPRTIDTDVDQNRCIFRKSDLPQHFIQNMTVQDCENGNFTIVQHKYMLVITIAPTVVAVMLLSGVIALYVYRLEVQVLLYSKFHVRLWAQAPAGDQDKVYDVFVSYNTDDRLFVAEQLLPNLEGKYRVCVHERDFAVGAYIADTIIDVVERSCRTLVVLSPRFVQSGWCLFEFKFAHYQALKDKCCRLIVIVLEEVEKDQLNSELRAYMRTNTFLRWEDPLFWEKLVYSMPDKKLNEIMSSSLDEE